MAVKHFYDNPTIEAYAFALLQYQINIDVISPLDDFSKYKLIIAPSVYVVTPSLYQNLEAFVANGGTLLLSFRYSVSVLFCIWIKYESMHIGVDLKMKTMW